jgi:hypothetical protein
MVHAASHLGGSDGGKACGRKSGECESGFHGGLLFEH